MYTIKKLEEFKENFNPNIDENGNVVFNNIFDDVADISWDNYNLSDLALFIYNKIYSTKEEEMPFGLFDEFDFMKKYNRSKKDKNYKNGYIDFYF